MGRPLTCQLTMTINDTPYQLESLPPAEQQVKVWRLVKQAAKGEVYDVWQTFDGTECSCPDYCLRRRGNDSGGCKHIRSLVQFGLIENTPRRYKGAVNGVMVLS